MGCHVGGPRKPTGEADRGRVTRSRGAIDLGAAGVRQLQQARDLVERLPRGVVHRLAEEFDVAGEIAHEQQGSVPAAHQQRDGRVLQLPRVGVEDVGRDVPDEVVHRVQRLVEGDREPFRGAHADHERPGESGAARHGHRVDVGQGHAGFGERRVDRGLQRLQVRARGDLGHDAAVTGVLVHARGDGVAEELPAADDPDTGLVAAGLDAQHEGRVHQHHPFPVAAASSGVRRAAHPRRSSCMTIASTSSGW
ncbi:hypothetical protein SRABI128_01723 [Microbacterium sp. Bi128]|nr:hypothetical protein SRABI128_01723 [Microbacterium sp. Bi128]